MSNKSVQHWDVVNLGDWVADYVAHKLVLRRHTELKCDFSPEAYVFVDQFQLDMVVRNLIENAQQSMEGLESHEIKRIEITVSQEQDQVALQVSDTGRGLDKELLARVFDPLFSTKQYGFGMGLTLSRNLVEFLGGRLDLSSEGKKLGAVATLCLPQASVKLSDGRAQLASLDDSVGGVAELN